MAEIFAYLLLGMVFVGMLLAVYYIYTLTGFFKELRRQEPELWRKIGSPTLWNMMLLPFINFRKFYAFMPHLRNRRHDPAYRYAPLAFQALSFGLGYVALLFLLALAQTFFVM